MQIQYEDSGTPQNLIMVRPDDWHLHLRDGDALASVACYSARQFNRAIVMPNLKPPVRTTEDAMAYHARIVAALTGEREHFIPLMTLYLTDETSPEEMRRAKASGLVVACKYYPAGATTNSQDGVTDIRKIYPVLEAMQKEGLVLCLHGEVTDPAIDIFDREAVFIDRVLIPLRQDFPALKIVMEHITTENATEYVYACNSRLLGATITALHLLYNRNAIFTDGLQPHFYCLPVLKSERDRGSLVEAATIGAPFFFLGTDSAPHATVLKEKAGGHAGCFTALSALELYAEVFEKADALDRLEAFASFHGPDFYGLPRNQDVVQLVRNPWTLPTDITFGDARLKPLRAGQEIPWKCLPRS
ncbi:MAG: dihydroorotase [Candidatus Moraniibacteriota bacterium]